MSCGQDIEGEKHTHTSTRSLRECKSPGIHIENTPAIMRFQSAWSSDHIIILHYKYNLSGGRQCKCSAILIL